MSVVSVPVVDDVPRQFNALPRKVRRSSIFGTTKKYLGARNTAIPWPDYTSNIANTFGLGEHFQGVQRIGRRLILSGGIKTGVRRSQLVVIDMGSQSGWGPWALPEYGHSYKDPPPTDATLHVVDIDRVKWHPGGIQALGNLLAVPIYGDTERSEIRFFEFDDSNTLPRDREDLRLEKSHTRSKAVGLTHLGETFAPHRYVMVVWDDEYLDIHLSEASTTALHQPAGFGERTARLNRRDFPGGYSIAVDEGQGTYQNVNLVTSVEGGVYLVATRNSQRISPTLVGKDWLDLYQVSWPGDDLRHKPRLVLVNRKQMYCYNQQCNFGAAAGIHVDDRQHLFLYAAAHWLHGGNSRINFNEYSY